MNDNATLSRATSRTSKQGTSVSRNQSLIRKHITPQDLKTVEVLTERFVAWKAIVKQLISYFEVCHFFVNFCGLTLIWISRASLTSKTIPQKS